MEDSRVDDAAGDARPLVAFRVVEISTGIAGGYAGKLFADAGAEVIKVEPVGGDPLRQWPGSGADLGDGGGITAGTLFEFLAAGKRSITVDDPSVAEIIATADLVLEDQTGDVEQTDPLVVVSITPFGRSGPWADRPATEFTVQAECGSLGARGRTAEPPVQAGGLIAEWVSGAYAAATGLAAMRHARRTGRGASVDISEAEVMCISTGLFTDLMMSLLGRPPLPQPPRVVEFPSIAPTADGWVGFNTNAAQMFDDFLVLIGQAEYVGQAMNRSDPVLRPRLEAAMEAWTRQHTTAEVIEEASLYRIPVAPVGNGANLPEHEHLQARKFYVPGPAGEFVQPQPPYAIDGSRLGPTRRAPALGEDNGHVMARRRSAPAQPDGAGELPFSGLRVLDMTCWWAGPSSTSLLAALGADVIHVESVQRIDGMRPAAAGVFFGRDRWWEYSAFFLQINVNKRGITLNLADPRGLELARQLIRWADVVAENYTPRVMDAFGLDWPAVHQLNPQAVMIRMPAYGLDGPWRERVGFAQTMEAMSGLAWVTGFQDGPPMLPRGPCDPNGGMHAAFATQLALIQRERTGEGVLVEAPLIESALNIAAEQVVHYSAHRVVLGRHGNRTTGRAPQGVYRCQGDEQWVAISVETDIQWAGLRQVLGDPPWARDPSLDGYAGRQAAADRIDDEVARWTADQDVDRAVELLVSHGVPAAAVADFRSISNHPLFAARRFFEPCDHPVVGSHLIPGQPFRYSGVDRWIRTPAPTVGQHNEAVFAELLGLTGDEIEALRRDAVIGDAPVG